MLKPGHVQTGKWSSPSLFGKCHNDLVARCHFRPPPFFARVLQEHVWRWSSTNTSTHTWRGSWGLSAKGKLNLHVIRLVWSRYFSVCWRTKLENAVLKHCGAFQKCELHDYVSYQQNPRTKSFFWILFLHCSPLDWSLMAVWQFL